MRLAMLLLIGLPLFGSCVSKSKYDALRSSYDQLDKDYNQAKRQLATREARAKAIVDNYLKLWEDLAEVRKRGLVDIKIENGRPVIQMKSDILFASGSAELTAEGESTVKEVARILGRRTDETYQIEGHTDSDPISTEQYPNNWYLGSARAITVLEAMTRSGMPKTRVSVASYADSMPASSKEASRRIELVIQPDWEDLPGIKQVRAEIGKRAKGKAKNKAKNKGGKAKNR